MHTPCTRHAHTCPQHARVEGMLRFAHDVKSEMERHDAHKVTAPRLTLTLTRTRTLTPTLTR